MTLHNELLHTEYGLTHNKSGIRCHFYSAEAIEEICSVCAISADIKARLWEYLDVKAAFYLRAKADDAVGTAAEHRKMVEFVQTIIIRTNSLAESIQKIEGWRLQVHSPQAPPSIKSVSSPEDVHFASVFGHLAAIVRGIQLAPEARQLIPKYRFDNSSLVLALLDYARTLEPIATISPQVKRGPQFDFQKRIWVSAIVEFWIHDIGGKFSSTCKPEEGQISPLVRFVHACAQPIETNPSELAFAKLIKEIGPPNAWGSKRARRSFN